MQLLNFWMEAFEVVEWKGALVVAFVTFLSCFSFADRLLFLIVLLLLKAVQILGPLSAAEEEAARRGR